jgi:hypothetical protein
LCREERVVGSGIQAKVTLAQKRRAEKRNELRDFLRKWDKI